MISKVSFLIVLIFILSSAAQVAPESRKSYLEDIFIWKVSDELKFSVHEEKKFQEIQKDLNKKKSNLNKKIQSSLEKLPDVRKQSDNQVKVHLDKHRNLLRSYNQLSVEEFDGMRKLLGSKKFVEYLQIKNDLTNKVKLLLVGEKEKKDSAGEKINLSLPAPKVILQD